MMRQLPGDVARCAGRFGLGPDDPVCERRDQCLRYQGLINWPNDDPERFRIPVHTGLCASREDWMIGGEA